MELLKGKNQVKEAVYGSIDTARWKLENDRVGKEGGIWGVGEVIYMAYWKKLADWHSIG